VSRIKIGQERIVAKFTVARRLEAKTGGHPSHEGRSELKRVR
jgi:hypothetical protein